MFFDIDRRLTLGNVLDFFFALQIYDQHQGC